MNQLSAALGEILIRHGLAGLALIQRDGATLLTLGGVEREAFINLFDESFGSRSSVEGALAYLQGKTQPQLSGQGGAICALSNQGDWLLGLFFFGEKGNVVASYLKARAATQDAWQVINQATLD